MTIANPATIALQEQLEDELAKTRAALMAAEAERDQILASASWRVTKPLRSMVAGMPISLRKFMRGILRVIYRLVFSNFSRQIEERQTEQLLPIEPTPTETAYERWIRKCDTLSPSDRIAIRDHISAIPRPPLISILMSVQETSDWWVRDAIASVRRQLYPHWELCIVFDAPTRESVNQIMSDERYLDSRIKWIQLNRSPQRNETIISALQQATGVFVVLLGESNLLSERALYEVAVEIDCHPEVDMIYTDEDRIDDRGGRFSPYFKPDWDIDLMLGQDLTGCTAIYRRTLVERVDLRNGFPVDSHEQYTLALRIAASTMPERIRHIPSVLSHSRNDMRVSSRQSDKVSWMKAAIENYLLQEGVIGAEVTPISVSPIRMRTRWPFPDTAPRVSLIVPTRDRAELLARCVSGLLHRTDYPNMELLIVDNDSADPDTRKLLDRLQEDRRVRVLHYQGPFNYAALNNAAMQKVTGEIVVLINNDIEVIDSGWLTEMVSHVLRQDVGAVGAKLLFANDTIQHAGIVLGVAESHVAGHFGYGAARDELGAFGHLTLTREVSAVTGACLALRRETYEAVGGMDAEHLPVSFNDVDLCLRIREYGLRVVWTPFAELYHLESASRGGEQTLEQVERAAREIAYMRKRWGMRLDRDPFQNPNFDRADPNIFAAASRHPKRWAAFLNL